MARTNWGVSLRTGTAAVALDEVTLAVHTVEDLCPPTLATAIDAAMSAGRPFAVALIDIEDFSRASDSVTRPAGAMEAIVSRVVAAALLPHETAVRHRGGVVLVLTTPHASAARALAEDVRRLMEEALWDTGAVTVTVCCGVAMWQPGTPRAAEDLLVAATQAVSVARTGGLDRVIVDDGVHGLDSDREDAVDAAVTRAEVRDLIYLCPPTNHLRARLRALVEELELIAVQDEGALVLMLPEGRLLLETVATRWTAAELRQLLARTTSSSSGGAGIIVPAPELLQRLATPWLPRLLAERSLCPALQPIRDLGDGRCVGQEALMRGELDGVTYTAAEIIEAAQAHDLAFAMDAIAWTSALEHGLPRLGDGERLHVNITLPGPDHVDAYLYTIDALSRRCDLSRVVIEITEANAATSVRQQDTLAEAHQRLGTGIALDHVSAGVHSLRRISQLHPELVKLDHELTRHLVEDDARIGLIRAVADHAHRCCARVVAVGVESVAECVVLRELGVDLGQGDYLGPPQ